MEKLLEFDPIYLFIIVMGTFFIWIFTNILLRDLYSKLTIHVFTIGFLFYSGIGLSLIYANKQYIISYFTYYLAFCIVILSISRIRFKDNVNEYGIFDEIIIKNWSIFRVLGFVYPFSLFLLLFFPNIHLIDLFKPWILFSDANSLDVFNKRLSLSNNYFYIIIGWITVLTRPFYFISLFKYKKKPFVFILWVLVPFYIDIIAKGSLGRDDFIFPIVLIIFYLYTEKYITKTKLIGLIGIFCIIGVPLMNKLYFLRKGESYATATFGGMFSEFLNQEATFPLYYDLTVNISNFLNPSDFLLWLFTLPIPNFLLPNYNPPLVNEIYTYARLGMEMGDPGYYIVVPSWLGEAFMFYGGNLSWLHGILIAIIIGIFIKFFKSNLVLKFWFIYFLIDMLRYLRSVSQEFLAQSINSSILFFAVVFALVIIRKQKIFGRDKINVNDVEF
ncbi:hypothetical protein M1K46_03490 [Fictibacillus sp. WQ 8-8]|uniref:hypothetical protein n=1 Tax=Fictibacillus sp. WQ 8-8 TaxID=2938788 RepID=UPI00210D9A73|nr:hypothetical protein [Fictibacillus sp. WQ 8-8]MCQ6264729.1 hypothetical protein [Fictibacillus sp. WQ 8-8]